MTSLIGHVPTRLSDLERQMISSIPEGGNWMDIPSGLSARVDQIRRRSQTRGLIHTTYYGRLRWDAPAYTISTFFTRSGNGCFIHPSDDRLITPREAARLQSFPDDFVFFGSVRAVATQIGNAVPPLLAYQVASALPGDRVVDLFAGAGGFSVGSTWAGKSTILAVEADARAVETYAHNHRSTDVWLAKLGSDESLDELVDKVKSLGGTDILAGGPPCQSFSTAGRRLSDERSTLVNTFVQMVDRLRPPTVVMENVHGLRSFRQGRVLAAALQDLSAMGYQVDVWDLSAEAYGVPQRRRRLFVVASRSRLPQVPDALFPKFRQGRIRGSATPCVTTRDAISDLPAASAEAIPMTALAAAAGPYQTLMRGESDVIEAVQALPAQPWTEPKQLPLAI